MINYREIDTITTDAPSVTLGPTRDTIFNDAAVILHKLDRYHSVAVSLNIKRKTLCFKFASFWDKHMDYCGYKKLFKSSRFANTSYCLSDILWASTLYPYLYPNVERSDWGSTRMGLEQLGFVDSDYRLYCKIDEYAKR